MRTVYKYKLSSAFATEVWMPRGARIVCSAMQDKTPTIWAEVETQAEELPRLFETYATGAEVGPDRFYVGTVFNGPYVWHIYEKAGRER